MENIMINFFGFVDQSLSPVVEYFPVSYGLIDFGESVFLDGPSSLAPPRTYATRPTSAPEVSSGEPFDPFAADVYQTARFLLEQFYVRRPHDPLPSHRAHISTGYDRGRPKIPCYIAGHGIQPSIYPHFHGRSAPKVRRLARLVAARPRTGRRRHLRAPKEQVLRYVPQHLASALRYAVHSCE